MPRTSFLKVSILELQFARFQASHFHLLVYAERLKRGAILALFLSTFTITKKKKNS